MCRDKIMELVAKDYTYEASIVAAFHGKRTT